AVHARVALGARVEVVARTRARQVHAPGPGDGLGVRRVAGVRRARVQIVAQVRRALADAVHAAIVDGAQVPVVAPGVADRLPDARPCVTGVADGARVAVVAPLGVGRVHAPDLALADVVGARVAVVALDHRPGADAVQAAVVAGAGVAVVARGQLGLALA